MVAPDPAMFQRIAADVVVGRDVRLAAFVNLYGCEIGDESRVGTFVEVQRGAKIGKRCKIQSHTFICEGVEIADEVFVGHGVMFINDTDPRSTTRTARCRAPPIGSVRRRSSASARASALARRSSAASRSAKMP